MYETHSIMKSTSHCILLLHCIIVQKCEAIAVTLEIQQFALQLHFDRIEANSL